MKKYIIILTVFVASLGVAGVARAGTADLHGWGWSSTIGYVSFNSTDAGTGNGGSGTSPVAYKVVVSTTTGASPITGYAWSSNVGWIKFGGLGTPPSNGVVDGDATVDLVTGKVSGWARACSGTVNKDCVSADRTDGWDGWIELEGNNHSSPGTDVTGGVTLDVTPSGTGAFRGKSWGSTNVGWLSFAGALCPGCVGTPTGGTLAISCSANPASLSAPGPITITGTVGAGTAPYFWNGSLVGGSVSTSTYIASYTGVGIPFSVRDSASPVNTGSVSCSAPVTGCSGGICGGGISGSCSSSVNASGVVTLVAVPSGQTGTVTYVWTTGVGQATTVNNPSYSYSPGNGNYTTGVAISDTNGHTGNFSCGNVSVSGGAPQTDLGPITLRAYKSLSSSGTTTLRIGVNRDAFLGWHKQTGLDLTGYTCRGVTVTKPSGSSWNDTFDTSILTLNAGADSPANYSTSGNRMRIGRYKFNINCTKAGSDPIPSNFVDVIVTTSGIQEI